MCQNLILHKFTSSFNLNILLVILDVSHYQKIVKLGEVGNMSHQSDLTLLEKKQYRSGRVNSNMVNSKFHLIRSYWEIFVYNCLNISCLKCTVNSNFHLIRSKTLPTNDFELTVPDLYTYCIHFWFKSLTQSNMIPIKSS